MISGCARCPRGARAGRWTHTGTAERLVAITLRGAGYGHGAGMCQQGAIGMAEAGHDYRAILRHYNAGAEVKRVF